MRGKFSELLNFDLYNPGKYAAGDSFVSVLTGVLAVMTGSSG